MGQEDIEVVVCRGGRRCGEKVNQSRVVALDNGYHQYQQTIRDREIGQSHGCIPVQRQQHLIEERGKGVRQRQPPAASLIRQLHG